MSGTQSKAQKTSLPSVQELLLAVPLYELFPFNENEHSPFFALEYFEGTLDCYCEGCRRHSVFTCEKNNYNPPPQQYVNYVFSLWFTCSRDDKHQLFFLFRAHGGMLQKVGQYPSLADLAIPDLQKYRNVLGEERYRELSRAVGLVSHGVGIGAFVYLRRIFEALIEKAHAIASSTENWDEDAYKVARVDEKIGLLRVHLPRFLVEDRALYGILSKGIHSLTEDECLKAFPIVKLGIELILDEEIERVRRDQKIKAAKKEISDLGTQLRRSES